MTRFERELSGALGAFWKKEAEKELASLKADLESGKITIDEQGVARNCIGRVLMSDLLEKLTYITDKVDAEATKAAREDEVSRSLSEYRRNAMPASHEELDEMRAAFGEGARIVEALTGETITL